jgi:hypothetical protein
MIILLAMMNSLWARARRLRRPDGAPIGAVCAAYVGGNEGKTGGKAEGAGARAGVRALADTTRQGLVARQAKREIGAFHVSDGHCAPIQWRSLFLVANRGAPSQAPLLRESKAQNSKKGEALKRRATSPPGGCANPGRSRNSAANPCCLAIGGVGGGADSNRVEAAPYIWKTATLGKFFGSVAGGQQRNRLRRDLVISR